MGDDGSGFFDTTCAADYLGLSRRTLDGYRVSGDGPAFHRFGATGYDTGRRIWTPGRRNGGLLRRRRRIG